jgi:uncharacterized iron-regulated membrane protein
MSFRKLLFWMHLVAGCVAGVIIFIMSFTGVLLTYERQLLARADRGPYQSAPAGVARLSVDELVARLKATPGALPRNASLVLRAKPSEPVEVSAGRGAGVYVSPYDGRVLGRSNAGMHETFQKITAWHRWLATDGEGRATARMITGACNFAFLFIVLSGIYLWLPKLWTARHLRPIAWFKGGLSGKARDFNWHNVFGIWMAVPLAIIVATGLPMSYRWANDLLYKVTGSEIPPQGGPGRGGRSEGHAEPRPSLAPMPAIAPLLESVKHRVPDWRSISVRLPDRLTGDLVFTVDTGDGGQPQKRSTLTLDPATGIVKKAETFDSNSAGRRLRTWARFAHTGEYYGIVGQTIAGLASLAGVMLVWTGISLALRRLAAWRERNKTKPATRETSAGRAERELTTPGA